MKNNYSYRLYGRTKGRKKNSDNSFLQIKLRELNKKNYNIIDIGAGFGESTITLAKRNRKNIIISCDKYIDGLNNLFKKTQIESLDNIYIYQGNVHKMLDEFSEKESISEVWILFPDPWTKKKHFKRRLIDKFFFEKIDKFLKNNAIINIATDSKSYVAQILKTIDLVRGNFMWLNQSKAEWDYNPKTLPETKYYKKARKKGLNSFYVKLKKL